MNILVPGANSGFGLLTARKFVEAGHTVHAGFRSKDRIGDLEALALGNGAFAKVLRFPQNISSVSDC